MRVFAWLFLVACLSGCSVRNSSTPTLPDGGGHAPFQGLLMSSPTLVYIPQSNQFVSLDSLVFGETVTYEIKNDFNDKKIQDHRSAVNVRRRDLQQDYEDARTSLFKLSGVETRYPNWIFNSEPPGVAITGLEGVRPLHTPQRIMNLPEEKISSIVALGRGYAPCYYCQASRKTVVENGVEWVHLLCRLPKL